MPLTVPLPVIALSAASPSDVDTDLLAVPVFDGDDTAADLRALDDATGGALMRAQESRELQGRLYQMLVTPVITGWRAGGGIYRRRHAEGIQHRAPAACGGRRRTRGATAESSANGLAESRRPAAAGCRAGCH